MGRGGTRVTRPRGFGAAALTWSRTVGRGPARPTRTFEQCAAAVAARNAELGVFTEDALVAPSTSSSSRASSGPLRGLCFSVKDIFTSRGNGWATRYGCGAFGGHIAATCPDLLDAAVVQQLADLGAVNVGKVRTTELACYSPAPTGNPHDTLRTAGGSSCGSAVSVATGMCHLSVASQTTGSIVRPAAFNGVFGLKPSYSALPTAGALAVAPSLDTVGLMADDLALLDVATRALLRCEPLKSSPKSPKSSEERAERPPSSGRSLRVGVFSDKLVFGEYMEQAEPYVAGALDAVLAAHASAGGASREVTFPPSFRPDIVTRILQREASGNLLGVLRKSQEQAGVERPGTGADQGEADQGEADQGEAGTGSNGNYGIGNYGIGNGNVMSASLERLLVGWAEASSLSGAYAAYGRALVAQQRCRLEMDALFDEVDVVLAPSTTGVAPLLRDVAGSPFPAGDPFVNAAFTCFGNPCLTLPVFTHAASGMPLGVQLVGKMFQEAALLDHAKEIMATLQKASRTPTAEMSFASLSETLPES